MQTYRLLMSLKTNEDMKSSQFSHYVHVTECVSIILQYM